MIGPSVRLGRFRIVALRDADFALDGGSMFGVVPRVLWERLTPVYEDHTIPLATTPYYVEGPDCKIVVEGGLGRRWSSKEQEMFHMDWSQGRDLLQSLSECGVRPEEITHCLLSHTHWDHIGAICNATGEPVFPHAEHWTPASEFEASLNPGHLRRASYRAEDIQPIQEAGLLRTFRGTAEPLPGVRMVEVGGHSDGVSLILIEDAGRTACFWADVVPTSHHVALPYIMAFDQNAAKSFQVRSEWIPRAGEQNWVNLLYHDPVHPVGRFVSQGKRWCFDPNIDLK